MILMKTIRFLRNLVLISFFMMSGANAIAQPQLSEYYPIGTTWEEVHTEVCYQPGDAFDGTFIRYSFTVDQIETIE